VVVRLHDRCPSCPTDGQGLLGGDGDPGTVRSAHRRRRRSHV